MSKNDDDKAIYSPIQCQLYDYFEIACMGHYRLDVMLLSGEIVKGKAITTLIKDKQEFLCIELVENSKEHEIRLDLIKSITALDKNAEFETVTIN